MGIDLRWKDEEGANLGAVEDPAMLLARHVRSSAWPGTACLRFLDPHGDAVFNQRQVAVLVQELEDSLAAASEEAIRRHVTQVVQLLRQALGRTHTYAWFEGD